ncbi:MAG TPA: sodium:proton antiporter NhaD [Chitinophagaceae bacterium]|nr:sodium:proton antiporter NhaD [Chitinophagaceae bacterium]
MTTIALLIFCIGYFAIAFEHPLRINKAAPALITGVLCWLIYFLNAHAPEEANEQLVMHLGDIASILFFLLGAMTIVELIDSHNGFAIITDRIKTTSLVRLLVIITTLTFFLSALLDNLTTAIVMTSLSAKIIQNKEARLWFAGMIIIAANAGGAWSPIGDVTTTMLWIGEQVTAFNIIKSLILPSLLVCLIPLLIVAFKLRGKKLTARPDGKTEVTEGGNIILFSGFGLLVCVPVFKTVTHMPPFMGMLLALAFIWIITTIVHSGKESWEKEKLSVANALQKVDAPSILFFLGILLAVSALQTMGVLQVLAEFLTTHLKSDYAIGTSLGVLSAIVDNVPLVAAAQGMYDLSQYPTDHRFWEFLALTSGTGGSMIIIGSAAGVAVMGIENINFMWYLKKISWLALVGFVAGILLYILQQSL